MDFELSRKFLWTDSTVALRWANTDKIVPVFVRNRVKTIQSVTSDVIMRYVPTKDNPADIGSRGATLTELQATDKWWNGPDFLMRDETTWPVNVPATTMNAQQSQSKGAPLDALDGTTENQHAIGGRILNIEDARTLMKETEAVVNTRPLTYVTNDRDHIPIRPIDFLRPYAQLSGPYPQAHSSGYFQNSSTYESLIEAWIETSKLLSSFWKRWTSEYLTSLREQYRNEHHKPRSHESHQPEKGDFVLVYDPILDRGQWKMGEVIGSRDGFRRSADIRLASRTVITRPNNMIYKLELHPASSKWKLTEQAMPALHQDHNAETQWKRTNSTTNRTEGHRLQYE
ncbi:unnamed protein product [Haemonchus placei]|uniref:DUF5641 domain-containing protein n=1 Tax=Haemonchus placei TaxID=6290 RepID=A0A0N4WYP1_HAEPC|nr:unnamed protein product [Haemonchus placei]